MTSLTALMAPHINLPIGQATQSLTQVSPNCGILLCLPIKSRLCSFHLSCTGQDPSFPKCFRMDSLSSTL